MDLVEVLLLQRVGAAGVRCLTSAYPRSVRLCIRELLLRFCELRRGRVRVELVATGLNNTQADLCRRYRAVGGLDLIVGWSLLQGRQLRLIVVERRLRICDRRIGFVDVQLSRWLL